MNESRIKRSGLKWPVCTLLILALFGGLGYWGYAKFQEERTTAQAISPAGPAVLPERPPPQAGPAYRGHIPTYFLVGFSLVMTLILGTVLYLWWSLKDLEGGKRPEEDREEPIEREVRTK